MSEDNDKPFPTPRSWTQLREAEVEAEDNKRLREKIQGMEAEIRRLRDDQRTWCSQNEALLHKIEALHEVIELLR